VSFSFTDDQAERLVNAHERIANSLAGIDSELNSLTSLVPLIDRSIREEYGYPDETAQQSPSTDGVIWTGPIITMTTPHACGNNMCRQTQDGEVRCFGCDEVLARF
jgi:hypothetical protein